MSITIIVKKSNTKSSIIRVDDVDAYVNENNLIKIEPINEMLAFKTSDYFEEEVLEQLPDDVKQFLQTANIIE